MKSERARNVALISEIKLNFPFGRFVILNLIIIIILMEMHSLAHQQTLNTVPFHRCDNVSRRIENQIISRHFFFIYFAAADVSWQT